MSPDEEKRLADLVWRARIAHDRVHCAACSEQERIEALRAWDEIDAAYSNPEHQKTIDELAARVGLPPLFIGLRLLGPDLRQARVDGVLDVRRRKRGGQKRRFAELFDLAGSIGELRLGGMSHERACDEIDGGTGRARKIWGQYRKHIAFVLRKPGTRPHIQRVIALLKWRAGKMDKPPQKT